MNRLTAFVVVLVATMALTSPLAAAQACDKPPTGLVPLTDLGTDTYLGHQGGLYPGGSNEVPAGHLALGLRQAEQVVPRAADGRPDPDGRIGMISIGVSNTLLEFEAFLDLVEASDEVNPALIVVNGAQGSRSLEAWAEGPDANPWRNVLHDIERQGLTAAQVQVAWVKLPPRARGTLSLDDAAAEMADMKSVLTIARQIFPNLRLAYLSSRIYANYSPGNNAEPKAYQNGFAVKWVIEDQIEGDPTLNADPEAGPVEAPWIAWGPYLWADGLNPRSDGLTYECADLEEDGIHPGPGASAKVARLLYDHLTSDPTAQGWFLAGDERTTPPSSGTTAAAPPSTLPPQTTLPAEEVERNPQADPPQPDPPAESARTPEILVATGVGGLAIGALVGAVVTRRRR